MTVALEGVVEMCMSLHFYARKQLLL